MVFKYEKKGPHEENKKLLVSMISYFYLILRFKLNIFIGLLFSRFNYIYDKHGEIILIKQAPK